MYSLTFRFRRYAVMCADCQYARRYVVIVTKLVHRLQIRPQCITRGHPTILPSYIRVRAVVWECGEGQTDTQTHRHTDRYTHMRTRVWPLYISRRLRLAQNVNSCKKHLFNCSIYFILFYMHGRFKTCTVYSALRDQRAAIIASMTQVIARVNDVCRVR